MRFQIILCVWNAKADCKRGIAGIERFEMEWMQKSEWNIAISMRVIWSRAIEIERIQQDRLQKSDRNRGIEIHSLN